MKRWPKQGDEIRVRIDGEHVRVMIESVDPTRDGWMCRRPGERRTFFVGASDLEKS